MLSASADSYDCPEHITRAHHERVFQANSGRSTLRRSSLVVTSTFSTVYVDAHAAGTPAIAAGIMPEGSDDSFIIDVHNLYTQFIPYYEHIEFFTNKSDLRKQISATLLKGDIADSRDAAKTVYAAIAGIPDVKAGERPAVALERLRN